MFTLSESTLKANTVFSDILYVICYTFSLFQYCSTYLFNSTFLL